MRKRWITLVVVPVMGVFLAAEARATDYSAPGPLQVTTGNLGATEGGSIGGYVVVPEGAGPYPLIIASHGWSAAADQQVGWGKQFAVLRLRRGRSLVPEPAHAERPDRRHHHRDPREALRRPGRTRRPRRARWTAPASASRATARAAWPTTLATAAIHPQATVLFDPVDSNGDGQKALLTVCNPVLGIFATASSCNDNEAWWPYANTTLGPEVLFHVVDSTHCDGENASRTLCGSFCGGNADPTRQAEYARYATAFFLATLAGDANAAATLGLQALSADTGISDVIVKAGSGLRGRGQRRGHGGARRGTDCDGCVRAAPSGRRRRHSVVRCGHGGGHTALDLADVERRHLAFHDLWSRDRLLVPLGERRAERPAGARAGGGGRPVETAPSPRAVSLSALTSAGDWARSRDGAGSPRVRSPGAPRCGER